MSNGTVKFFNNFKGFGFITPETGEKDVFVHKNGLIDEINEGDKVPPISRRLYLCSVAVSLAPPLGLEPRTL